MRLCVLDFFTDFLCCLTRLSSLDHPHYKHCSLFQAFSPLRSRASENIGEKRALPFRSPFFALRRNELNAWKRLTRRRDAPLLVCLWLATLKCPFLRYTKLSTAREPVTVYSVTLNKCLILFYSFFLNFIHIFCFCVLPDRIVCHRPCSPVRLYVIYSDLFICP